MNADAGSLKQIAAIDRALRAEFRAHSAPVIELIEAQTHDPFSVLVGTILSSRTKDACTAGAVKRLFATRRGEVFTPADLERLEVGEIERLIYPVGFYRDKARHLKALPAALAELLAAATTKHGAIEDFAELARAYSPDELVERLCVLPGVGRKTANLTVAVGFDLPAVCVDVHVHRISNRLGLVRTATPLATEMALRALLPRRYWKTWNSHLVSFGQTRCRPCKPVCEGCPIAKYCAAEEKTVCRRR